MTSPRPFLPAGPPLRRVADRSDLALALAAPSLLLVDDDPGMIQVLSRMLTGLGHLHFALSGAEALDMARAQAPDLMLVDAEMPGMNGFELCTRLKADLALAEVPVIFVTGHGEVETEVAGFAVGAADFIRKPPVAEVVQARVRTQLRLKALADALRRSALTDGMTGVANRRRFDEDMDVEAERARRNGDPLALLMVDVDLFKRYNDRYGHLAGDACLRAVAGALKSVVQRPADRVARYGGEEFAILLPQTELDGALQLARHAVDAVTALRLPHADSPLGGIVTVSVGAAVAHSPREPSALIQAADQALYAAKHAGRACCRAWQQHAQAPAVDIEPARAASGLR